MKRVVFLDCFQELKLFLLLWLTQSFSALGSAMTSFALIIWSYQTEGSALTTALLSVCSYMPYVFMSIFAGALSDRWNKKVTMLVCDTVAACCTVIVLYFLQTDSLQILHLYCLNAVNGLMNTVQQPASDVTASGIAMLVGSVLVSLLPAPKSRVRVICNTLLLSMSTENFFLAFGKSLPVWCVGTVLGWISIPIMSANLDALLRSRIPLAMQGRVYAARNTLQFFTIPLGYGLGGYLVDYVFEPWMAAQVEGSLLLAVFGSGKGSGASLLFFFIAVVGVVTCLLFRMDKQIWQLEQEELS